MYCWGFILGRVCKRYSLGCFKGNQDIQFLCTSTEGALTAAKRRILSVGSTEHHKQCCERFHPHVPVLCPCNTSVWECLCLNWNVFTSGVVWKCSCICCQLQHIRCVLAEVCTGVWSQCEWAAHRELDKGDAVQACPSAWWFWSVPC